MRKSPAIAVFLLAVPGFAFASPTIQESLSAAVAACRITGSIGDSAMFVAKRDHGEQSKVYKAAVAKSYKDSRFCSEDQKEKIRPVIRSAVDQHSDLRPQIMDAYAKWITYMDWLADPHDLLDKPVEARAYEDASNRLKAEIELQ